MAQTNDLFDPGHGEELTRQPGRPSEGGDVQVSAEEAAAQARAEVERANQRAADAEQRAAQEAAGRRQAEAQAREATVNTFGAHEGRVLTAIDAQSRIIDGAKVALANAFQSQDGMAMAEAQSQLAQAHAALAQLNAQKEWIGQEKVRQEAEARRPQPQPEVGGRLVETPSGKFRVSATTADWMDKHPRFYDDEQYHNFAIAAHQTILNSGVGEGTPAYFKELTHAMTRYERLEAADQGGEMQNTGNGHANGGQISQRQQQRRAPASSYAAPPSRASAPQQRGNGTMSALQVARRIGPGVTEEDVASYAKIAGMSLEAYLKEQSEIADLERQGQPTGLRTDEVYR